MNPIYRKIFLYSFLFYMVSTAITKLMDCDSGRFTANMFYALPSDSFLFKRMLGTSSRSAQIGVLSHKQVIELLKTNPDIFPYLHEGLELKEIDTPKEERDYLVLRFKNRNSNTWGDLKYYYSFFSYSITEFIYLAGNMSRYQNIIMPYPQFLEKDSKKEPEISLRWKN